MTPPRGTTPGDATSAPEPGAGPAGAPTFVFDGDCGFCTRCAEFAQRWIPGPATIAPWQHLDLAALDLTEQQCDEAVQWVAPGEPRLAGPEAIAALMRVSRPWWRVAGALLGWRPVRAVAWPVYRWIARNRHRMPGGTAACALPGGSRASA